MVPQTHRFKGQSGAVEADCCLMPLCYSLLLCPLSALEMGHNFSPWHKILRTSPIFHKFCLLGKKEMAKKKNNIEQSWVRNYEGKILLLKKYSTIFLR